MLKLVRLSHCLLTKFAENLLTKYVEKLVDTSLKNLLSIWQNLVVVILRISYLETISRDIVVNSNKKNCFFFFRTQVRTIDLVRLD